MLPICNNLCKLAREVFPDAEHHKGFTDSGFLLQLLTAESHSDLPHLHYTFQYFNFHQAYAMHQDLTELMVDAHDIFPAVSVLGYLYNE